MSSKRTRYFKSSSSKETSELGRALAREILKERGARGGTRKNLRGRKAALIVGLRGDLGAGKTTFIQGFIKGLGSGRRATSPTFVIMRRHPLKKARQFRNVFHIDAYRIKKAEHLAALDFGKIAGDPKNIILIEWADRAKKILPKKMAWMRFRHGRKENERTIIMNR